jgi:hypothetical protein
MKMMYLLDQQEMVATSGGDLTSLDIGPQAGLAGCEVDIIVKCRSFQVLTKALILLFSVIKIPTGQASAFPWP